MFAIDYPRSTREIAGVLYGRRLPKSSGIVSLSKISFVWKDSFLILFFIYFTNIL